MSAELSILNSSAIEAASLNLSNVTSAEDALKNVTSLEGEFQFNRRLLLNVIAYSVMFVVGTIGNTLVRQSLTFLPELPDVGRLFQNRRKYFTSQNVLGYLCRCKFLQRWLCNLRL
jgi:hypothetical protein